MDALQAAADGTAALRRAEGLELELQAVQAERAQLRGQLDSAPPPSSARSAATVLRRSSFSLSVQRCARPSLNPSLDAKIR